MTAVSEVMVVEQEPEPEHPPPLQPEKVEPEVGVADRVTDVPEVMEDWVQVEPQFIVPPVTVPDPVPDLETERV